MPKILVTGYGGFLGAEISRQLIQAGFQVRGIARGKYPELAALGVETIRGDICDPNAVQAACAGCVGVVHTAAKAGVWGPWHEYYQINALATLGLLAAARKAGVKIFVHSSSPSVTFDGEHQSGVDESAPYATRWLCHYPHSKALAEQAVLESTEAGELYTCCLRPHLIWGRGDPHLFPRVVARASQGRLLRVGSGQNLIDVVHVASAARGHVQAVEHLLDRDSNLNRQALFLTDGDPIACWEWVSRILETAEIPVPERAISYAAAYRLGAMLEAAFRLFRQRREPPMTRFVAAQLALDHYFSIDRARKLLDYDPAVDRDAELQASAGWLRGLV